MDTLGQRIRFIREFLKYDQIDLAKAIGFKNATTVSKWENDEREPDIESLLKIVNLQTEKSLSWLIKGRDTDEPEEMIKDISGQNKKFLIQEKGNAYLRSFGLNPYPIVSKLSAGPITEYFEEVKMDKIIYLPHTSKNCIALIVEGDSMKDLIDHGDMVLVDLNIKPRDGDIVAVRLNNDNHLIKRYLKGDHEDYIILYSNNPLYPPKSIRKDKINQMYRVVKVIKDV